MGLIDKLDKSYVIIGLIKPFLDDKLYYITEHLDQVKVPWKVFREDDREPLIGFKWKDWIDRRRNIKNVKTTLIAVILITTGAGIINLLQSIYTGG